MFRVYFDASVIIAGLISSTGGSARLLELVKFKEIIGITSQTVIEEVLEKSEKIGISRLEINKTIKDSRLLVRREIIADEIMPYQNQVDTEDAHVVAGAIFTKCDYLVTLDKMHLLRPDIKDKFSPLRIIPPKEILEKLIS